AAEAFEQVVELDPRWRPGRINLGIALLNTQGTQNLDRATALFEQVLREDNNDPYAHHCLGLILNHRTNLEAATAHFRAVTQIDPGDAGGWYWLAQSLPEESDEKDACYKKAVQLDPYLSGAI